MRPDQPMRRHLFVAAALLAALMSSAQAGNGINEIGFGVESVSMGGADLAVARDTSALNTNPAGLVQIRRFELNYFAAASHGIDVAHSDALNRDTQPTNRWIGFGGGGFAYRFADVPIAAGVGFFGQGGAGAVYQNLRTPFGNRDELSAQLAIAKLSPGLAWQMTPQLSVGASLGVLYSLLDEELFPNTSSAGFAGFHLKGLSALGYSPKLGVQYRLTDRVTLGAAYTGRGPLDFEGGRLTANFSAQGLGLVTYRDVKLEGLAQPQQIGAGIAWRPLPSWLLAFDVDWIDWSNAVQRSTLRAASPDNPAAPALLLPSVSDWRDQWVLAVGMAYEPAAGIILRAGYNYAASPIPSRHFSPLLNGSAEHTVTFGAGSA